MRHVIGLQMLPACASQRWRTLIVVPLIAFVLTVPCVTASSAATRVNGNVGPGSVITLKRGGSKVTSLPAGRYTLVVTDRSAFHNFHLTGQGVDVATGVAFKGSKTFTITLRRARTYRFVCDPHREDMRGSFRVT